MSSVSVSLSRADNQDPSEFEIQAEAYLRLKERWNVRGEYHYRVNGKRAARFDIAILSPSGTLRLIVEVKRRNRQRSWAQAERYGAMTGLPVLYIRGMDQAREAVSVVCDYLASSHLGLAYLEG